MQNIILRNAVAFNPLYIQKKLRRITLLYKGQFETDNDSDRVPVYIWKFRSDSLPLRDENEGTTEKCSCQDTKTSNN